MNKVFTQGDERFAIIGALLLGGLLASGGWMFQEGAPSEPQMLFWGLAAVCSLAVGGACMVFSLQQ